MHQEPVLKRPTCAVDVAEIVDRGPARVDARLERLHDRVAQLADLAPSQRPDRPQWVDARAEQRLVGVDVAHARDSLLGEEKGLHGSAPAGRELAEGVCSEVGPERLDSEPLGEVGVPRLRPQQRHPGPEPARVTEEQAGAGIEHHPDANVGRLGPGGVTGGHEQEVAGHSQVHDQEDLVGELRYEVLPAPIQALDVASVERSGELRGRCRVTPARIEHLDALQHPPFELRLELTADRLDFGELGHPRRG